MTVVSSTAVTANTPITGTFTMPMAVGYFGASSPWNPDSIAFRSHTANSVNISYTFTPTGEVDTNPLEGSTTFAHSTISSYNQRVFGFTSGKTYNYTITTTYTGNLTFYWAYSDASDSAGSVENLSASSIAVTAGTPVTGTLTVPTTAGTTYTSRTPDTLILRSHTNESVTITYNFTQA